ncbi:hypothetical protein AK830_g5903 [Neonectria ditissima]|uniref:Uncharacterized protein n=1 Tax=Neonectria ditissima TaxID=78410 RepID=A0A0P7BJT4_9HYPO|nr:hypothetical protein AK830_g5903 [Neonectria ditissima]
MLWFRTVVFLAAAPAVIMAAPYTYSKPSLTSPPRTVATTTLSTITRPTQSIDCDYKYCESNTSWCFYFVPFTTFDISEGPLPGETRTSLGPCGSTTAYSVPTY